MTSTNLAGYQAYQRNKYQTASPHKLILMLYSGAINFAEKGKQAITDNNIADTNKWIQKVQDIIYELVSSLNPKAGGEIAHNLNQLYMYMIQQLIDANVNKKVEKVEEVIGLLKELQSAWEEIGKGGTLG
ncbi:flagellar protein FliS [Paenibacillus yonginensis]|uniref:Flagellar secretion chaperone FliS n=1 Tax=Paenibacillus yonginensis TaxID=1462996 RepID=A0A1B1N3U7_9BACL|nr:flagellar export chaperone FliS [Paenibacillus yonginensis]ANS76094.1 flagellar protein FliS [Paenibacillus yonginensis]